MIPTGVPPVFALKGTARAASRVPRDVDVFALVLCRSAPVRPAFIDEALRLWVMPYLRAADGGTASALCGECFSPWN